MRFSRTFDDDLTLRGYASAHREAAAAPGLVGAGWAGTRGSR
jgi:hypothetical protein